MAITTMTTMIMVMAEGGDRAPRRAVIDKQPEIRRDVRVLSAIACVRDAGGLPGRAETRPTRRRRRRRPGIRGGRGREADRIRRARYEVVADWPKPLSQLPGHEKWTWGRGARDLRGDAESRVPPRSAANCRPSIVPRRCLSERSGRAISFPVTQTPFRNASVGPARKSRAIRVSDGWNGWKGKLGVDARWEHCVIVVDATRHTSPRTGRSGTRSSGGRIR